MEKRVSVLWAGGMRGCIERYSARVQTNTYFVKEPKTMRQLPALEAATKEIGAEAQKTSKMTFFVHSCAV
jgi:hypothetical protein